MRSLFRAALVVVLSIVGIFFFGNQLFNAILFHPIRGAEIEPERIGLVGEGVFLESEDGIQIHAFWLPVENSDVAILFLHGNGGNASYSLLSSFEMVRLGASVLVLDYRGYGLSEGTPTEEGVYQDARAGLAYLTDVQGFPENRIIIFGQSLGGAVAVDLAQDRKLGGLILVSTFESVANLAKTRVPFADLFLSDRFDSGQKIARLRAPVLFLHGDRDGTVPIASGRSLFERAPEPKNFVIVKGAGHNNMADIGGRFYWNQIDQFIKDSLSR